MSSPPPTTPQSFPGFDQIVKGNVTIKKLRKYKYKITFSKIGKFLVYQVWDKDNVNNLNDKRTVGYLSAKEWINIFNNYNKKVKEINQPLFTPTTIMETADELDYAFVIRKAYINSCDQVVFTVSTKEISLQNNTSKKIKRLPCGKFINMRFDIDSVEGCILTSITPLFMVLFAPQGGFNSCANI
jgi:hypothetical protein